MITQEKALSIFSYVDGVLYWRVKYTDKIVPGKPAGHVKNGYMSLKVDKKDYRNHRIIFLMHHGYFPLIVDHIDGNPLNNRIENLRAADFCGNSWNSKLFSTNTSGERNVVKKRNKWAVEINVANEYKYIGSFKDYDFACIVAREARNFYHKEFANHGKRVSE